MKQVQIQTTESFFESLVPRTMDGANTVYPFLLRIAIAGYRVTPRHSMFQYLLEMGAGHIEAIIRHQPLDIKEGAELLFVFPERHLSVHEQQAFLYRLGKHPDVKKIKRVDIVTQNALIVTGTPDGCASLFHVNVDDHEASLLSQEMTGKAFSE